MTTQLPTWHGGDPRPPSDTPASGPAAGPPDGSAGPTAEVPAARSGGGTAAGTSGDRGAPGLMIGGRYQLRTAIGHGGMGTVWRATDTLLRRDVAVKEVLLPQGMAASDRDSMYQRTLREARAAAALSHPSVVQVYDVVTESGRPWIVMELLQSRSLAEMIVEDGPLAPRAVAKIGIALLGALEVAHAAGVLHRDVKPANVLICGDGRCVLTDFGVARMPSDAQLTTPGMVLGSPHFISPERAIGAAFGPPSDLFSLGVTLYTAVEGRPPFDRPDPFETMRAVVEEPPAPAMRAGALAGVLYGLLEKDPTRRWNVEMSRAVLRDLLSGALASNTPAHETDPYAVVRPAPYAPPPPTAPPVQPTGQIGGRAMISPNETVSGAIRRLTGAGAHGAPAPRVPVDPDATNPGINAGMAPLTTFPYQVGGRHAAVPAQRGAAERSAVAAAEISAQLLGRLRGLPARTKVLLAAGAAAVILLAGVAAVTLASGGGGKSAKAIAHPTASADTPLIATQEYRDQQHGVVVNVPAGWKQDPPRGGGYMNYVDPLDSGRWVRINIEKVGDTTGRAVLEAAGRRFQTPNGGCAGYQQVGLRDGKLAGHDGAVLEYTCAPASGPRRHGIWQTVVVGGQAYQVTLSTTATRFDESRVIFDEMVRSFRLAT